MKLTKRAKTTVVEQMLHEIEDAESGEVQMKKKKRWELLT